LQNNINAEAAARIAADAAIQADVDQNEADSDAADTQLQANIDAEAAARAAADNTLQGNIDALTSLSLADTPSDYGTVGQVLIVNETADGLMWATNGSTVTAGVSFLNDIEGSVTIESGNDNATVSEAGNTITIEVKPKEVTETVVNKDTVPLTKGTPVYINGSSGNTSQIIRASSTDNKPAHLILNEDIAVDAEGEAIAVGFINNVSVGTGNASNFSSGQEVWLGPDGTFVTSRPTGATDVVQKIGVILQVDTNQDTISGIIFGTFIREDLPNLTSGHTWRGNASNHPEEYNLDGLITLVNDNTNNTGTNADAIIALQTADTDLQGNIDAEAATRAAADTTITDDVTALTTRVTTAEGNITSNDNDISALDGRVTTAEGGISANSTSIGNNTTAITDEVTRATNAETMLQSNIDAEASTRAAADATLQTNIDTETTNRQNADTNLNTSIIANTNSINAIKDRVFYQDTGGDDKVTLKPDDATVKIDIDGTGDVIEFTAGNVKSTTISSTGVSTKALTINDGTADVFSLPTVDGSADQVLTTNGSGTVTWTNKSSSNDISISGLSAAGDYDSKAERWLFGTGTTSAGRLFYLSSTGAWAATDASAVSTAKGMLGVAVGTTPATNGMITRGFVRLTADTGGNVGDPVYMSETAESITNTPPSTSGAVVRVMGYKVDTSIIYFNPSPDYFTVE
jgi:hypothetical protein